MKIIQSNHEKNYNCTSQQQSCQTKQGQVSVGWFAEQDEEEGDMENINHFLIFHPEVGIRVEPKLSRVCAAPPGLVLSGFVNSGRGIRGMAQGKVWLCDAPRTENHLPQSSSGGLMVWSTPVASTTPNPGLQEGGNEFKGTSFFIEGDPEHWKFTLKSRPPGHEFQE